MTVGTPNPMPTPSAILSLSERPLLETVEVELGLGLGLVNSVEELVGEAGSPETGSVLVIDRVVCESVLAIGEDCTGELLSEVEAAAIEF